MREIILMCVIGSSKIITEALENNNIKIEISGSRWLIKHTPLWFHSPKYIQ